MNWTWTSSAGLPGESAAVSLKRLPAASLIFGLLPGLLGAMLAFFASNIWFYHFGFHLIPGVPSRTVLPDFFSYLQIDAYVGVGCGYAGAVTAQRMAGVLDSQTRFGRLFPALYSAVLGITITLIVNAVLLFMSYI